VVADMVEVVEDIIVIIHIIILKLAIKCTSPIERVVEMRKRMFRGIMEVMIMQSRCRNK
jgi:hypothetical protein